MGQLKQVMDLVQKQLARLSASHRMLIASLVVIMLMTFFVVSQYAGGQSLIELLPVSASADQQQSAQAFLSSSGIDHDIRDGRVVVPADKKYFVLGQMGQQGALPDDSTILFSNLVNKTPWTMPSNQVRQISNIALQNELALVISNFTGVHKASVFIDAAERAGSGLGRAHRKPTATATITPNGAPISQHMVDAVAHLIAGSKAGLDPSSVRVIDASTGRQHRPRDDDDFIASTYFEHANKVEDHTREKLHDMLQYIDGVIIAVTAQVDVTRRESSSTKYLPSGSGTVTTPTSEIVEETVEQGASAGAEAGVRSNTGVEIPQGGSTGSSYTRSSSDSQLASKVGAETNHIIDPRGMPTRINATINVPKSFFVQQWRNLQGSDADAESMPTEADLTPIVDAETTRIHDSVLPMVQTQGEEDRAQSIVTVSMIPDLILTGGSAGSNAGIFSASGGGGILANGWIKTAVLGLLALVALFVMSTSLKRASKPVELPSAQELVGVPPPLSNSDEMVGEAGDASSALTGLEIDESDLELRQKVEQVATMVKEKPSDAARLLSKWITSEV